MKSTLNPPVLTTNDVNLHFYQISCNVNVDSLVLLSKLYGHIPKVDTWVGAPLRVDHCILKRILESNNDWF